MTFPAIDISPPTPIALSVDLVCASVLAQRVAPSVVLFSVDGSLDLSNANAFGDFVHTGSDRTDAVVVDLSAAEFIGTAVLSVLTDIEKACRGRGTTMTLVTGTAADRVMAAARWNPDASAHTRLADALAVQ